MLALQQQLMQQCLQRVACEINVLCAVAARVGAVHAPPRRQPAGAAGKDGTRERSQCVGIWWCCVGAQGTHQPDVSLRVQLGEKDGDA